MKPPVFHRIFDYDRSLLPTPHLGELENGVTNLEEARASSGLSIGYPGWTLIYNLLISSVDRGKPAVIVETGTNRGSTTVVLAQALRALGGCGHVTTFEIDPQNIVKARENLTAAGVSDLVTIIEGDAKQNLKSFAQLVSQIDFAFLDGSHLIEDVLKEFEAIHDKLAPGALVCFDNTYKIADEGEHPRVFGALKEIKRQFGGNIVNLPNVSWYTPGFAIWQRTPLGERAGFRGRPGGKFHSLLPAKIRDELAKQKFFHAMELNGFSSGSFVYGRELPPNYHLYPGYEFLKSLDLTGAACLDLGTFDGMTAFQLCELGAKEVHAVCQYELDRFLLVHALMKYQNLFYHPRTHLSGLGDHFSAACFDFVAVSAMLHHHPAPSAALIAIRRMMKTGGYFMLEAAVALDDFPKTALNTLAADPVFGIPMIWIPGESDLAGMLMLAGFDIVAVKRLQGTRAARENNYRRVTFLARAERPSQIRGRSEKLAAIQDKAEWIEGIDFKALETGAAQANISFKNDAPPDQALSSLNIWFAHPDMPLQPKWRDPLPGRGTQVRIATCDRFRDLMAKYPAYHWSAENVALLSAKYPGESWPDGMDWSLKQFGNLHCLDVMLTFGLECVLEVGPGFNMYFHNKLPGHIDYWRIDDEGFYADGLLAAAKAQSERGVYVKGVVGGDSSALPDAKFDCCFSVSALEHVPENAISATAADLFRLTRPGGWNAHSLDFSMPRVARLVQLWLAAFQAAGFVIDEKSIDFDTGKARPPGGEIFLEPMSIVQKFHGGYEREPWSKASKDKIVNHYTTVLFTLRRPPD